MSRELNTNLLQETLGLLKKKGHTPEDVLWVGSPARDESCSWEEFAQLADRSYDSSCGSAKVRMDLVVAGSGWWLERHEYDGSEWWEYKTLPVLNEPTQLTAVFSEDLLLIDDEDDKS